MMLVQYGKKKSMQIVNENCELCDKPCYSVYKEPSHAACVFIQKQTGYFLYTLHILHLLMKFYAKKCSLNNSYLYKCFPYIILGFRCW